MSACDPSDRLMQSLRVRVPGATDELISLELFNFIDLFFRRTNAWTFSQEIALELGSNEYPLGVPGNATIVRELSVSYNDTPVFNQATSSSVTQSSLAGLAPELVFPDGDATFAPAVSDLSGDLFSYAIYAPTMISVNVPEGQEINYPLKVSLALSVGRGCLECDCGDWDVPEWCWDSYFQVWLDGTMATLFAMPAKPWSNEKHAIIFGKKAYNKMSFHKQEARRGFSYATRTWSYPRGWT